jgi:hypothetical protein
VSRDVACSAKEAKIRGQVLMTPVHGPSSLQGVLIGDYFLGGQLLRELTECFKKRVQRDQH